MSSALNVVKFIITAFSHLLICVDLSTVALAAYLWCRQHRKKTRRINVRPKAVLIVTSDEEWEKALEAILPDFTNVKVMYFK